MKTLLLFIGVIGFSVHVSAQSPYYNQTKTFHEKGYSYQCDYDGQFAKLYNLADNQFIYEDQKNRYTGKYLTSEEEWELEFESETWTHPKCYEIVNNAFSTVQKASINGVSMFVSLYINSDTGKVIGVEFEFDRDSPYMHIPLSVFRQIELELKRQIWFTLTDAGRRLNYIYLNWEQYPGEVSKYQK